MDTLFKKVSKFLSKANAAKEKKHIENKIKTAVITHGPEARTILNEEEKAYISESEESEEEKKIETTSSGRNSSRKSSSKSGNIYFARYKKKTMDN